MGGKSVFVFLANTLLFSDVLITALIMEKCYYIVGRRRGRQLLILQYLFMVLIHGYFLHYVSYNFKDGTY